MSTISARCSRSTDPDLIHGMSLGGDLLILSWLKVVARFRGNKLGHSILKAVLSTIGRSSTKVIIEATPTLTDNGPMEGTPEYLAGKAAMRQYWESFGFHPAHGDYLVFDAIADGID